MKKFLISVIFIIPVLIVLAISATGAVIKNVQPVNAKSIVIKNNKNEILDANTTIMMDINSEGIQIYIEVLPSITFSDEIIYEIDDIDNTGSVELIRDGTTKRYTIKPVSVGAVRLIIRAKNNRNTFKTLSIFVNSDKIDTSYFYNDNGDILDDEIAITEPYRIYADFNPIEALVGDSVSWSTSNIYVAVVDNNGVVSPRGKGRTALTLTAQSKNGTIFTNSIVIDTTKAVVRQKKVFITNPDMAKSNLSNSVSHVKDAVEDYILTNVALSSKATVEKVAENNYLVTDGNETARVEVEFVEPNAWNYTTVFDKVFTNNAVYNINCDFLDNSNTGKLEYTLHLSEDSDPAVANLQGTVLLPRRAGEITVVAKALGMVKAMKIIVRERPLLFNLALNREDYTLGVQQKRLWGNNWYDENGEITHTLQFGSSVDANADILWSINDASYASIDENNRITFNAESAGKTVVITATAMLDNYKTNVARTYTFNMCDNPNAINVKNFAELQKVTQLRDAPIIFQNNITNITAEIVLKNSLYGNGFMYDAKRSSGSQKLNKLINIKPEIFDATKPLVFEDVVLEGSENMEDSFKEASDGVFIEGVTHNIELNYVIGRYFKSVIVLFGNKSEIKINGCIIGYSAFTGVLSNSIEEESIGSITIKNSVFTPTNGPSMVMTCDDLDSALSGRNYMTKVSVEGFLDVYNWKTFEELEKALALIGADAFASLVNSGFIKLDALTNAIGQILRSLFETKELADLCYVDPKTKEKYISLGFFFIGLYGYINPSQLSVADKDIQITKVVFPRDNSTLGILMSALELTIKFVTGDSNATLSHPSYLLNYRKADGAPVRNKPGDPVPETKELYNKLLGKTD